MKVTIENKKGLNVDIKVFIDKKTMNIHMDEKYQEIKGTINLKGFRPGKVPRGRFLEVEEFTSLVCWLSSEENSFSTAAVFDISGGRSTY